MNKVSGGLTGPHGPGRLGAWPPADADGNLAQGRSTPASCVQNPGPTPMGTPEWKAQDAGAATHRQARGHAGACKPAVQLLGVWQLCWSLLCPAGPEQLLSGHGGRAVSGRSPGHVPTTLCSMRKLRVEGLVSRPLSLPLRWGSRSPCHVLPIRPNSAHAHCCPAVGQPLPAMHL